MVDSFHFFRTSWIKTKLIKLILGYRHWSSEMSSSMCCVDLNNDTLKILGTHFSNNEKLKEEKNLHVCDKYSKSNENMEKLLFLKN